MTPQQFQRVRDLFERALELSPPDVGAWLDAQAADDRQVRAEVAALLKYHSHAGSFLAEPLAAATSGLLEEGNALQPGTTIGAYRIERELGRGGMGQVYLARDLRLGRPVALKALPPRVTRAEADRERLRREARAAAALTHPGICTVFALEELNGDLFLVSEYVEGHTLREEIDRRLRPSPLEVFGAAQQLAEALASAHAKGITHRDLKPENIMRTVDGRLKILDFGLAKFERPDEGRPPYETEPGTIIGTPAYMAPEQLNGLRVDARADVFAFGVVIYEYASGVHPFMAPSPMGVAARVLQSEVAPLDAAYPALPASLVAVVDRCLRKAPADRFQTAGEIRRALTGSMDPPRGRTATAWWRRHQIAVIGLYLVASVLGWQVKEWLHGSADTIFLLIGVLATAGAIFRGHLMFTERVNGAGFSRERGRVRPIVLWLDLLISAAVAADGVLVAPDRPLMGVLTFALAVGLVLQGLLLEPSTTNAAFERDRMGSSV